MARDQRNSELSCCPIHSFVIFHSYVNVYQRESPIESRETTIKPRLNHIKPLPEGKRCWLIIQMASNDQQDDPMTLVPASSDVRLQMLLN